jgi:excisionase family DNA binding protein
LTATASPAVYAFGLEIRQNQVFNTIQASSPMPQSETEYLTTRELAELLRIKERKVYDLAASGDVPCSRAMGKLLFRRREIDAWLARSRSGGVSTGTVQRPNVLLGSYEPILEWTLRESRCGLATFLDGSLDGLDRFAGGEGLAAGLHIFVPEANEWNLPVIRQRFAAEPVVMVEWCWRERGLIVAPDEAGRITDLQGLRGKRFVPRQSEAGSQRLFEYLLEREHLAPAEIELTAPARSEADAVLAVAEGKADATLGLLALARQYRLGFIPVIRERFDLLVDRRSWFEQPLQTLLRFCRSDAFAAKVSELEGYDFSSSGQVRFNGP